MTISDSELIVRLIVAAALCGLIGFEREARDQVAGLRTHMLVGLGAALFTLVSAHGFEAFIDGDRAATNVNVDPSRIAAQVVTGIGFLGAGAIIRQGFNVRGLTTAASMWAAAAIGMAAGAGYYLGGVITTVVVLLALFVLRRLRHIVLPRIRTEYGALEVDLDRSADVSELFAALVARRVGIRAMETETDRDRLQIHLHVKMPPGETFPQILKEVSELAGVKRTSAGGLDEHDELGGP